MVRSGWVTLIGRKSQPKSSCAFSIECREGSRSPRHAQPEGELPASFRLELEVFGGSFLMMMGLTQLAQVAQQVCCNICLLSHGQMHMQNAHECLASRQLESCSIPRAITCFRSRPFKQWQQRQWRSLSFLS